MIFQFIGIIVFLLMVRWSMLIGWYELIRNPKTLFRRPSTGSEDFVMLSPRTLASQQMQTVDSGVRRRSSGQVVGAGRPSVEEEGDEVGTENERTPTRTQFATMPAVEERGKQKHVREEEVMV